jgi:hypothetical protein
MTSHLLAIDQGTTSSRASVFRADYTVAAHRPAWRGDFRAETVNPPIQTPKSPRLDPEGSGSPAPTAGTS